MKFSPDDVMALMDLMSRNPKVAAACGRTLPMGIGPLVWYQIFDYAIGHWLLKVNFFIMRHKQDATASFSTYLIPSNFRLPVYLLKGPKKFLWLYKW